MLPLQIGFTSYATGETSCVSIALLARLYIFRRYTFRPFQVAELPFPILFYIFCIIYPLYEKQHLVCCSMGNKVIKLPGIAF
jgi:hypothetical protein